MLNLKNRFLLLQKETDYLFENAIREGVFPGSTVGISTIISGERKRFVWAYGNSATEPTDSETQIDTFYDLASLTKPLATTLAILCLIKSKKITLEDKLPSLLDTRVPEDKANIKLKHLLSHCSGLPAHKPYYEKLINIPLHGRREVLLSWIINEGLEYPPEKISVYSDLGFILLGYIIEGKSGKTIDQFVKEKVFAPAGVENGLFFIPIPGGLGNGFAATERCLWRQKIIQGEVHDDNAFAMGGVAGHAGLFGNIEGVLTLLECILDSWQGRREHPEFDSHDLKIFLKKQGYTKDSTWALGFDTPAENSSSSGGYLSGESVGHLGFTGTSFWIDPTRNLVMVLLANRVHPDRENTKIKAFRPLFHDTVIRTVFL